MEPTAVGIEEGDDLKGRHLCVKGVGVLEVVVPDLVDSLAKEIGGPSLSRLITGVVVKAGLMGQFCMDTNDRGGIAGNAAIVEGQAYRMDKVAPPWSPAYIVGSMRMAMREWTYPSWLKGISMRMGSSVSLNKRRL